MRWVPLLPLGQHWAAQQLFWKVHDEEAWIFMYLFIFPSKKTCFNKKLQSFGFFFSLWMVCPILWNEDCICYQCLWLQAVSNNSVHIRVSQRWSWLAGFTHSTSQPAISPAWLTELLKILQGEQGAGFCYRAVSKLLIIRNIEDVRLCEGIHVFCVICLAISNIKFAAVNLNKLSYSAF